MAAPRQLTDEEWEELHTLLRDRRDLRRIEMSPPANPFLTKEQLSHLTGIKEDFCSAVDLKYRAGAAEHGGDLLGKSPEELVEMALEEVLDLVVYVLTLRDRMNP